MDFSNFYQVSFYSLDNTTFIYCIPGYFSHYLNLFTHVPFRHSFYLICAFSCRLKEDLDHITQQLEVKGKGT